MALAGFANSYLKCFSNLFYFNLNYSLKLHLKIAHNGVESFKDNDHANCGGTLLDDHWIITAAHCFSDQTEPKIFLLNGHNFTEESNYKLIKYDKIIIHPSYQEFSGSHEYSNNDIALIRLSKSNKFKKVYSRPCLPRQDAVLKQNSICFITGFGASDKIDNQEIKRIKEGKVAIRNNQVCIKSLSLSFYDDKTMLCAGKARGSRANSCQGDSGGPLVCEGSFGDSKQERWFLFGITSFGALDCKSYTSSIYTKVSTYVDWIYSEIEKYN